LSVSTSHRARAHAPVFFLQLGAIRARQPRGAGHTARLSPRAVQSRQSHPLAPFRPAPSCRPSSLLCLPVGAQPSTTSSPPRWAAAAASLSPVSQSRPCHSKPPSPSSVLPIHHCLIPVAPLPGAAELDRFRHRQYSHAISSPRRAEHSRRAPHFLACLDQLLPGALRRHRWPSLEPSATALPGAKFPTPTAPSCSCQSKPPHFLVSGEQHCHTCVFLSPSPASTSRCLSCAGSGRQPELRHRRWSSPPPPFRFERRSHRMLPSPSRAAVATF
jgi:hypothetical protein